MAVYTLTHKFQKITLTGTDEHTIDFDTVLQNNSSKNPNEVLNGIAFIELASGSTVQVSPNAAIDADAGTITSSRTKTPPLDIRKGIPIRVKGGAGSEDLMVSIVSD